ncbi:SGNH/GDSL hydrolase family protein [Jannaschia seohaensis]|uniref:Lysophospholipase L1 n=1 Tax=Jannaschia seohaensis TaxID=475081 RepID=A0A2Y9BXX6_9RHOB|nr:SGNH/GDSL hydrolase family protein [Jannaschia seohaensis]PWJ21212.1 lysophospholipase L1-like esterase [Jannaschia seohaensis]SSA41622.1 Lysophospholipase L1 [Jannaschia seohaensis]
MTTILVFGDSNSHGTPALTELGQERRFPRDSRWPVVMERALDVEVVCEGHPGRTTVYDDPLKGEHKTGLRVLPALLESHRPLDLVMIMLGTNDCQSRFALRGWDIAAGAARLAEIVLASTAGPGGRAPEVMLIAPVPVEEAGVLAEMFQGGPARSRAIAPALRDEAARLGCGFFDAGRVCAVDPVDGVHLTAEAQRSLGLALAEAVRERLKRPTP